MSAPNISRIETSPAQNMTLETLVRIARALGREVEIALPVRRSAGKRPRSTKAKQRVAWPRSSRADHRDIISLISESLICEALGGDVWRRPFPTTPLRSGPS